MKRIKRAGVPQVFIDGQDVSKYVYEASLTAKYGEVTTVTVKFVLGRVETEEKTGEPVFYIEAEDPE